MTTHETVNSICHECGINPAEFSLRNGQEINIYCAQDFADVLVDLVQYNAHVSFTWLRREKNITYIETGF